MQGKENDKIILRCKFLKKQKKKGNVFCEIFVIRNHKSRCVFEKLFSVLANFLKYKVLLVDLSVYFSW